ncbi:MAG: hypothetical protein J7K98_03040 [Candidatus Aenigmarchaeota archaeon]|nr:hypothetical protein [Candidatus Aenigmarchaeota archaeon]
MMKARIMSKKEVKEFLKKLKERFGFEDEMDEFVFVQTKNGKIKILNKQVLSLNLEGLRVENVGLYFARWDGKEVRLSIEGSQIVGKKAKKNVLELSEDEAMEWMRGKNLEVGERSVEEGFVILKHKDDFLGCGRYKNGRILSFVPKWRRIK